MSEFKILVRELHKAGIEVILDVVYNHTGEGERAGPHALLQGDRQPDLLLFDGDILDFFRKAIGFTRRYPVLQLFFIFNADYRERKVGIPQSPSGTKWYIVIDTSLEMRHPGARWCCWGGKTPT